MKKSEIKALIKEALSESLLPTIKDSDKIKIKKEKLESPDGDIMDTDTYKEYEYKFIKSYPKFDEIRYKAWAEGDDDEYDVIAQKLIDKAYKDIKKQLKTPIKENTTFGDKLALHNKKLTQPHPKSGYSILDVYNIITEYTDIFPEGIDDVQELGFLISRKDWANRSDFTTKNKIYYVIDKNLGDKQSIKKLEQKIKSPLKEDSQYRGTITDDSAEYMLKDLGIKLQHQYDSISGTRFFGPLDQLKKARTELKLKYNVESKIDQSSIEKFGYSELSVPNQVVD